MSTDVQEAMVMLEDFRVTELRSLLSMMGKSKSGLKKDLMKRAIDVLKSECSHKLLSDVCRLHKLRQVSKDARRSSVPHHITPTSVETISMPEDSNHEPPGVVSTQQQMINLPFYQTLDTIMHPTPLVAVSGGPVQNSDFLFHLNASQETLIQNAQRSQSGAMSNVQVVLRICYRESMGVEEDQYPANIAVSVNHINCPVQCSYSSNKPETEPARPCRPIDITSLLYVSFTNNFSVTWGNYGKHYSVAVYLVRLLSSEELLFQLRSTAVERLDFCRQRVCEKLHCDPENEISTTGLQVSLVCPLSKLRMSVACRAGGCAHLQCFDAASYLQMNERKPRWICPVCHKYAPFDALRIDSLLCEVLESCGEDVNEIEYLSDSSWRPVTHDRYHKNKETVLHPLKLKRNAPLVDSSVVDLTLGSSDDEDLRKEEMVSTYLQEKRVLFRRSGRITIQNHQLSSF